MNNSITSLLFISLIFVSGLFSSAKSQPLSADSLSIKILDFPDSAASLSPLTFRISYNTNNRDMKLNATIGADPVDPTPRSFGDWVNGTGEITYHYRVPNHQRATGFWCTAYLTPDGSWNSRELVVTTANKVSKIIPVNYDAAWKFDVQQSASVEMFHL